MKLKEPPSDQSYLSGALEPILRVLIIHSYYFKF